MQNIIKYFGGKGGMYQKIIALFPSYSDYNTYIEPFGGSFSVGFNKQPSPIEIYNDLNKNVYSLFVTLSDKKKFAEFKRKCDLSYYSDDFRKECKYKLTQNITSEERAFCFFYVNRASHNGIGGFSCSPCVRRNMSKSVSDFLSTVDKLPEFHQRLSRVIILNQDGIKLIQKYNKKNVFIYCDPPYEQSVRGQTRYEIDMPEEKQKEFLNVICDSKAKIMVSGYRCDLYNELDRNGFKSFDFPIKTMSGNFIDKTIKNETIWVNYNIPSIFD